MCVRVRVLVCACVRACLPSSSQTVNCNTSGKRIMLKQGRETSVRAVRCQGRDACLRGTLWIVTIRSGYDRTVQQVRRLYEALQTWNASASGIETRGECISIFIYLFFYLFVYLAGTMHSSLAVLELAIS